MYAIPLQNLPLQNLPVQNLASVGSSEGVYFRVGQQQPPVGPMVQPLYVLQTAKALPAACLPAANALQAIACMPAQPAASTCPVPAASVCRAPVATPLAPVATAINVVAPGRRTSPVIHKPVDEGSGAEKKRERTVSVKDPGMRHTVRCEVPLSKILTTQGLRDLLVSVHDDPERPRCICRLWLEGRCGQGGRCRSLHVDSDFVMAEREKRKGDLADVFISEVAVQTADAVMSMSYNALARTQGLETFRTLWKAVHSGSSPGPVPPARLCPHYEAGGSRRCLEGRFCSMLHLRKSDRDLLTEFRMRTPCCGKHGDSTVFRDVSQSHIRVLSRRNQSEVCHELPISALALTNGLQRHLSIQGGSSVAEDIDICVPHGTSRCKYGRRCGKLHICRDWFSTLAPSRGTSASPSPYGDRRTSNGTSAAADGSECIEHASVDEWASAASLPQEDCRVPPPLLEDDD